MRFLPWGMPVPAVLGSEIVCRGERWLPAQSRGKADGMASSKSAAWGNMVILFPAPHHSSFILCIVMSCN